MIRKENVERFLHLFHQKIKVFGIIFRDDRGKNMKALLELEISPKDREDILKKLYAEDYIDGPVADTLHQLGDMWIFGKKVKGKEVYIKISMGVVGTSTICISFHVAEHQLQYQFKSV